MKITARQEQLSHALRVAGRAVAARSPLPITTNVLLVTDDGRLRLSATNLDIAISTWIDASVAEDGAITLPSRLLSEFVDTLPGGDVELTVKGGSHSAHVSSGRYEATIRGMAADDFPVIPTAGEQAAVSVPASLLKEMVEQVVFAAAMEGAHSVGATIKAESLTSNSNSRGSFDNPTGVPEPTSIAGLFLATSMLLKRPRRKLPMPL